MARNIQPNDNLLYCGKEISFGLIATKHGQRPMLFYPEAAGILAFQPNEKGETVLFVEQFRYGSNCLSLEIPAGKRDSQETIEECARRELKEETGYEARQWQYIMSYYPAISVCTEKLYLFEARELFFTGAQPDADEELNVMQLTFEEAMRALDNGKIIDSKTIIALQYWRQKR